MAPDLTPLNAAPTEPNEGYILPILLKIAIAALPVLLLIFSPYHSCLWQGSCEAEATRNAHNIEAAWQQWTTF